MKNPKNHSCIKHIDYSYYLIREAQKEKKQWLHIVQWQQCLLTSLLKNYQKQDSKN